MAKKTAKKNKKTKTAKRTAARAPASRVRTANKKSKASTKPAAKRTARKGSVAKKKTTAKKTAQKTAKKVVKKAAKTTTTKKTTTKKTVPTNAKSVANAGAAKKKTTAKKTRRRRTLQAQSVAEAASAAQADAQGFVYINGRRVRMISAGGLGARKTRSTKKPVVAEVEPKQIAKPMKTKLAPRELKVYKELLLQKRAELVGDVSAMEEAALNARGGNLSNLPIHMADIGTDTYDQDFMLGLAETERERLREIDEALARISDKSYGVCQTTGKPIPKARLNAKPWAKYTIEAARELEGNWRR